MTRHTREEKLAELRFLMREAATEALGERGGIEAYKVRVKNVFAGDKFDGFDKPQTDRRKALSEAILHTDAATLLIEVLDGEGGH